MSHHNHPAVWSSSKAGALLEAANLIIVPPRPRHFPEPTARRKSVRNRKNRLLGGVFCLAVLAGTIGFFPLAG